MDEDAGFLDAAVAAPDPPSGVPGGKSKVQVGYRYKGTRVNFER
jgi:hypothetical protein